MRSLKKKSPKPARIPRARNAHGRQRQRLIDACISALHIYGPSRTTVEKVVAIAKMSPGIVRFYFASKAAMLVASLQFLAAEFEEQLLVPVARLKSRVKHEAKSLVIYFSGDIISCSLLLRILLFITYRRPAAPRRAAGVMGAGGADGE